MKRTLLWLLVLTAPSLARAESTGTPSPGANSAAPPAATAQVEPAPPPPKAAPPRDAKQLPEVPEIDDEPLPVWTPPVAKPKALYLSVNPELQRAQKLRQAGLWLASFGGASLLAGGILYARALELNEDIRTGCTPTAMGGGLACTGRFHPETEDARDQIGGGAIALISVGTVLFGGGALLFTTGQLQIRGWHHRHPGDPMPALSGY